MTTSPSQIDILEYLQTNSGCVYLSDLCNPRYHQKLRDFLQTCDMTLYPTEQWDYAFTYIFNISCHCSDTQDLRSIFLQHLA